MGSSWLSKFINFFKIESSKEKLIKDVEEMMKKGQPIQRGIVLTIGDINWKGDKYGKTTGGYVDIPLKKKYNYILDKKLNLWAPKDLSKRSKRYYTSSQIKFSQEIDSYNVIKKVRSDFDESLAERHGRGFTRCPYCRKKISKKAIRCPHCTSKLD